MTERGARVPCFAGRRVVFDESSGRIFSHIDALKASLSLRCPRSGVAHGWGGV